MLEFRLQWNEYFKNYLSTTPQSYVGDPSMSTTSFPTESVQHEISDKVMSD